MSAADEMTCSELVELVTSYLEGALSPEARARFESHLAGCTGCAAYLRQMRDTLRSARKLSQESLDEGVREELLRAFRSWKRS